ncbi:hypothetical protein [uncultured Dysgonomonas sp.]|uniref:DUF4129 domain-containing protein n=1 Tax=uncultured Dysgonomonas sp. TaxID=206096 RepID=A0A212J1Q7_9BACT|nr:hypothetical protein [uncultured Dysgonomonas sp.]SBV93347.1 conserved exported hypothetical protein [uncultured Dysgonomonas sp.]
MLNNKIDITFIKGILFIFFVCLFSDLPAQTDSAQAIATPSAQESVDFRIPDEAKIKEYQNDNRFQYKRVEKVPSWWDKVKNWFFNLFADIFSAVARSGFPGVIVLIALIVIICLIVLKFAGVDFRTVFGKKKMDTPEIDIYTENVHNMDFDSLIANALKNKDYRLVIRFLYLKNLKLLTDKEFIEWKPNKTNYSYQYEIENQAVRSQFMETTLIFDYIWYGEFIPDETNFPIIYNRMESFSKTIANER